MAVDPRKEHDHVDDDDDDDDDEEDDDENVDDNDDGDDDFETPRATQTANHTTPQGGGGTESRPKPRTTPCQGGGRDSKKSRTTEEGWKGTNHWGARPNRVPFWDL